MSSKVERNDPCPCGSGRKYKHCCGRSSAPFTEPDRKGHDGAVERALGWLAGKHRKAVGVAIDTMLFDGLSDEEVAALEAQDEDTWEGIQLNATEWLLAEGEILVKEAPMRVARRLLAPGGPLFTVDQRRWIEQLAERPLRLYDVTEVIAGERMTLCDARDPNALPITVQKALGASRPS